jgi:hypothetical protein
VDDDGFESYPTTKVIKDVIDSTTTPPKLVANLTMSDGDNSGNIIETGTRIIISEQV